MRIVAVSIILTSLAIGVQSFVFSCEEVKYKLINQNLDESTRYVCLVAQEGYNGLEQLKKIYAQADKVSTSFADLLNAQCVERPNDGAWTIVADSPVTLDCQQEFSLIFTSSPPKINAARSETQMVSMTGVEEIIVTPQTGMQLLMYACSGNGNITVYTGAGNGVAEFRYPLASYKCADWPTWIVSFENVVTLVADAGTLMSFHYNAIATNHLISAYDGSRFAVMASGRSDNLQNLHPDNNYVRLSLTQYMEVNISGSGTFDARYNGHVDMYGDDANGQKWTDTFGNGTASKRDNVATLLTVRYNSIAIAPQDLWDNQDNFVYELSFKALPTTTAPATTTKALVAEKDPYCQCELDRFQNPYFDTTEIWLDVVIILDTSVAMGESALSEACNLIEAFIGTGDFVVLNTDLTAKYSTRVGLIAMSDKAETIYNLNMTITDTVTDKVSFHKDLKEINVLNAFNAAQKMLQDGQNARPDRENFRPVIYYMTDSDPKIDLSSLDVFKANGVIIVNNFIDEDVVEQPGLKKLASDGYYYTDIQEGYMLTIQLFCKANCFCRAEIDRVPYGGLSKDVAVPAAGGCYHVAPVGVTFTGMIKTCSDLGGGVMTSIHDDDKVAFVNHLYKDAKLKSEYYWIGYNKTDAGWSWQDSSSNPYSHWDVDEPSPNSVAKCAYVDSTSTLWGAGNCNTGFPSVCQFIPCSAGNKDC